MDFGRLLDPILGGQERVGEAVKARQKETSKTLCAGGAGIFKVPRGVGPTIRGRLPRAPRTGGPDSLVAPFWRPEPCKERSKNPPIFSSIFEAILAPFWIPKWLPKLSKIIKNQSKAESGRKYMNF